MRSPTSATIALNWRTWPARPRRPWAPTRSMCWPTAATSAARKSWPASPLASRPTCPAAYLRLQGQGPLRQAGLRLPGRRRRLSLPGRADPDSPLHLGRGRHEPLLYWTTKCAGCPLKSRCTSGKERRVKRWEHEAVIDAMKERLDRTPHAMRIRRATVEHPFGTLKAWMGATHFKTRTLDKVRTEMSLLVLAHNLKRVIAILGIQPLMQAMRA